MDSVETKTIGKYRIDVVYDNNPWNPREDDNLGTMVCFASRHTLGDQKHGFNDVYDFNEYLKKNKKKIIILPLYLYDHSGITMNTTGFSCGWDSGQVGWIYVEKSKVRSEYGWSRITKDREKKIREYLKNEVSIYDSYIKGECYGYKITDEEKDEEVESCWGYYDEDYCMSEAEYLVKNWTE